MKIKIPSGELKKKVCTNLKQIAAAIAFIHL